MENMTLRELCDIFGVTRRAVQGYEKAGLVCASGKNERGYLLYDKSAQERIRMIKMYQRLGFKITEIKWLMDASKEVIKVRLENQVEWLKEQKEEMDDLIELANGLIGRI